MTSRIEYTPALSVFMTPRGNVARMHYRLETNDWNTINSSMTADEYHLKDLPPLSGLALDVGAYVGSVGIALALDNFDLKVICIEPVSENADLVRRNIEENDLRDRVVVLQAGAASPEVKTTTVRWRYRGSKLADHHAFVGNCALAEGTGATGVEFEEEEVRCVSISELVASNSPICLLKIDCEGCEWSALNDPAVDGIPIIAGEWHPTGGKTRLDLVALLSAHEVLFEGPEAGPGGFTAVLKEEFFQKK